MNEIYSLIRNAILEKQQIVAVYKGYRREMCPHVLGTKNGKEQALFYQFGGESSSGTITADSPQNWRCMPLEELKEVVARSGPWYTATNHTRKQSCVDVIDVEVAP